jgi:hypothetical protein
MIVRCIDNTLQHGVLVVGREYKVRAEREPGPACRAGCAVLDGGD